MDSSFRKKGTLHFKGGLESVNFTKRFKRGGIRFDDLFTDLDPEDRKLRRKPLIFRAEAKRESKRSQNKTLVYAWYFVGKARIPVKFTGVWSYPPFENEVFVKRAILVGKRSAADVWYWRLILNIEEPRVTNPPNQLSPAAAIDLGYRRFPEYIRFGFVADTAGNRFELRLPTGNMVSAYLKKTISFLQKKGVEKAYVKDLNEYSQWDVQQATDLQQTKNELDRLSAISKSNEIEMPSYWADAFSSLEKMRSRGLLGLRNKFVEILDSASLPDPKPQKTLRTFIEIVDRWHIKDLYVETEKEHFRRKFFGRRRLLYRQTVKWLADNYSELYWKENLKLEKLATKTKQASRATQPALRESSKYRHWTSLHLFRLFVKETSSTRPGWLKPGSAQDDWPPTCDRCGAAITSDPSDLMLSCARGHTRDRDERAASRLLPHQPPQPSAPPISIPLHLKESIVPIK